MSFYFLLFDFYFNLARETPLLLTFHAVQKVLTQEKTDAAFQESSVYFPSGP